MIITRSPLRITLGGGGTDLPSYYLRNGGFVISAAIDKYIYITLHRAFSNEIILKYSNMERVENVEEIQHPIFKEALKLSRLQAPIEIASMADIPAGTGLGSSGSFTTALLKALHAYKRELIHPRELAEEACRIEIEQLNRAVGKQDQYIAAYGGLTCFDFRTDSDVISAPLAISSETLYNLEDNLLLFFTGYSRSASDILEQQKVKSLNGEQDMLSNLHFVKELGFQSKSALERADLRTFAELMNVHWEHKKKRSQGMSNGQIDDWFTLGRENGALGGKLVGAGGGGFLLFYTEEGSRLRKVMHQCGLQEIRFRFDFEGTKVMNQA